MKNKLRKQHLSSHVLSVIREHNLKSVVETERYINCTVEEIFRYKINRIEKIQEAIEENILKLKGEL